MKIVKWPYSVIKELRKEISHLKSKIKDLETENDEYKINQKIILLKVEDQAKEIFEKNNELVALNDKMRKKERDFRRTIEFKRLENLSN